MWSWHAYVCLEPGPSGKPRQRLAARGREPSKLDAIRKVHEVLPALEPHHAPAWALIDCPGRSRPLRLARRPDGLLMGWLGV